MNADLGAPVLAGEEPADVSGALPVPAVASRIAAIEAIQRDPRRHGEYDGNPAMQGEYRQLLARRDGAPVTAEAMIDDVVWQAQIASARQAAETVFNLVGDRDGFIAGFDTLPEAVQSAAFAELGSGRPGYVAPASQADVARFAARPEGADLVRQWGHLAPQRLAILRTRLEGVLARLPDDRARDALLDWIDRLPASDFAGLASAATS
jgi:hypothetical protein